MRKATILLAAVLAVCAGAAVPASALAQPVLRVTSGIPDYVTSGSGLNIFVAVQDVGDAPLSGPMTLRLTLPRYIKVFFVQPFTRPGLEAPSCSQTGQVYECVLEATGVPVGGMVSFKLSARVESGTAGPLAGQIEVSGGGASGSVSEPFVMRAEPGVPFATKSFGVGLLDGLGAASTQAATAPSEQMTDFSFYSQGTDNLTIPGPGFYITAPPQSSRDVVVHVPAGFVGYPASMPVRCKLSQLTTRSADVGIPECPLASQIGVVQLSASGAPQIVPLYDVEPPAGYPAEFGFFYQSIVVRLLAKLRPADNGIDILTPQIPDAVPIPAFEGRLWGVPGDSSHDRLRGKCLGRTSYLGNNGENCPLSEAEQATTPFLRLPTSCTGESLRWGIEVDTYQHPGSWISASATSPAVTGCESVPFAPSFSLSPSVSAPHAASGADATVSMPQSAGPNGVAQADVKSASVTLPVGMSLNPSASNGLQACTDQQLRLGVEGVAECPDASKIGSVTLKTPLLDHEIGGSIFIRTQNSSDPASGELFRIAIEVRSDRDGVDVKLPGKVEIDPSTGQITTVFENLPQLPFEAMTLHFEGGSHPVLVTPDACGTFATSASLTGWNGKEVGHSSPFTLDQGCTARGFAPGFTAGTTNPVAGAFAPFALQVTRSDNDQELSSLSSLTLPKGLLADIGSVPRCTDSEVAAAACPESTRLGNVTVGSGAGATPVYITDGNVYLTGPYKGAPFGLAFVIHAQAGPFDLGMVVVRAALNIDPHTAQANIQTDPLPTIVKGVPVRLRDLRVSIDRPHFMLNPTNCNPMKVTGTATSTQGAIAPVSSRFQVGECRNLGFKPSFRATTVAKTSRHNGASLKVKVRLGHGQANIAKVDVQVPKGLAVRDSTLNQACTEAVFTRNPAACPAGSFVGTAVAHTPILASALAGPAIFVSHGGARFPDLDIVLQGEGVTIVLTGGTEVRKNLLFSHFDTVPDAPVSSFALSLPQGPHSALAAVGDLCTQVVHKHRVRRAPTMPTTITGQNGAVVHQSTKVSVSGCGRPAKATPKRK
jgi:hypothetical protein